MPLKQFQKSNKAQVDFTAIVIMLIHQLKMTGKNISYYYKDRIALCNIRTQFLVNSLNVKCYKIKTNYITSLLLRIVFILTKVISIN